MQITAQAGGVSKRAFSGLFGDIKKYILREDGTKKYIFRSLIDGFFNHHSLYKNHVLREDDAKNNIFRGLMWGGFTIMILCCLAPRGTQKRAFFTVFYSKFAF